MTLDCFHNYNILRDWNYKTKRDRIFAKENGPTKPKLFF